MDEKSVDLMVDDHALHILTINSGSSSLKFALYQMGRSETLLFSGNITRIGLTAGHFHVESPDHKVLIEQDRNLPDHNAAFKMLSEWFGRYASGLQLDAVGHRVVHGGSQYSKPHRITPELVARLKGLVPLAPEHLPHEVKAIEAISQSDPNLRQIACFDTAFHRQMPKVAQIYALPRALWPDGIIRYGFHGLSYEYIMQELVKEAGPEAANGRVIIAHLGNGASMVAVRGGQSLDTTMGFTPAGGLMMSTRSGDLDPGIPLYLMEEKGLLPATVNDLVNQQAGLLGVSGMTSDMRDLLNEERENPHAAEAVALFCYQAKKFLGALAAVLGGLDTLIFTAGIGENAPTIRGRICEETQFFGIYLNPDRNDANAPIISQDNSPVTVRVMKTDEDLMIARHTRDLIRGR